MVISLYLLGDYLFISMSTFTKEVTMSVQPVRPSRLSCRQLQVAEEEARLKNFQSQAKVPGFRPGKALLIWCEHVMLKS